ncbi:ribonuclease D [Brumicola nitratireducens]|uniref:Ribonuclease D n=1 Tax=Glaciecola nitratireducens (strain JCM 12485 / KCTC 12276 / FR1064) TaxID=1085623 RepID=G4QHU7_GLANF|nr:ribonuclease D [Glaciecola nitratireducens]AEP30324.1 ribonuclease D [Glaciecola nitratireducens FR1064]
MNFEYIDTPEALSDFCERISAADALAIDTEFVRTRTLVPQLGLIQVYDGEHLGLIDPVALDDLSPFSDILVNPSIIKVLHSCSEDLDALWFNLKVIPSPLFDSQFAANLLDMGQTLGYANLVEKILDIHVDKGESRTDWIARPLSPEQLVYAAADVFHLLPVYRQIAEQVEELGQTEWVFAESEFLSLKKRAEIPVDLTYLSIKNNWKIGAQSRQALKEIASWRLQQAQKRDMAINFVLREQGMLEVAMKLPENKAKLFQLQTITPKEARIHSDILLELVQKALNTKPEDCPPRIQRLTDFNDYKKALASLKDVCEKLAQKHDTRVEVLASKKQLNQWLKWCWFEIDELDSIQLQPDIVSGWRRAIFAEELTRLFKADGGEFYALRSL